jgi:hypothetical protein
MNANSAAQTVSCLERAVCQNVGLERIASIGSAGGASSSGAFGFHNGRNSRKSRWLSDVRLRGSRKWFRSINVSLTKPLQSGAQCDGTGERAGSCKEEPAA